MFPKVSVIIPVYNSNNYLGQCLDSVLLQTLQDIEVICVDDGSEDDSLLTLQGYAFLDQRMKIIQQQHLGPGAARNRGLKEASGEFVICLDSDDMFVPEMLEKMVEKAEKDSSDVVICAHCHFDNTVKQVTQYIKFEEKYVKDAPCSPQEYGNALLVFNTPCAWNKLVRKKLLIEKGIQFDEEVCYGEDQIYSSFVLMCAKKISLINESFVFYRVNTQTQLTSRCLKDSFPEALSVLAKMYHFLKKLGLEEIFLNPFLLRCKRLMQHTLNNPSKMRDNLGLIRKRLPVALFDRLFLFPKSKTKVSIIIPVFNAENFLAKCLDSAVNQSLKDIEIVCINDGSSDHSLDILNQYSEKDSRIKVFNQENKGQARARNIGLDQATGTYIQFLDADDYMEKDTCECLYLYSTLLSLDMCQCASIEFDDKTKQEFENTYHTLSWLPSDFPLVFNKDSAQNYLGYMAVTAWLTFYRRQFLLKNDIRWINKHLAYEDTPFFVESLLKAHRIGALKIKFYHRRVHMASTTQQLSENLTDYIKIIKYTLNLIKKMSNDQSTFIHFYYIFTMKVFRVFGIMEINDKERYVKEMFEFYVSLLDKYALPLPEVIQNWCDRTSRNFSFIKRIKYKISTLISHLNKKEYSINLVFISKFPNVQVRILGFPLLYTQIIKGEFILYKIKFMGITILTIKEIDND